jgi:hypothetical protein
MVVDGVEFTRVGDTLDLAYIDYGIVTEAFDEETVNVTYVFEGAWELVPGEWVMQILHQNQVVARKAFQVYRP